MARSVQSQGGEARAKSLNTEQRREIAVKAAKARWDKIRDPSVLPAASHRGPLTVGEITVDAYRLKDGRRVISKKGMADILGLKSAGGNAFLRSMSRPGVRSEMPADTWQQIENPIYFKILDPDSKSETGSTADGYEAATLIDCCKAIVAAQQANKLHGAQHFLYVRAEVIMRAAAKLGITALVDAAVNYVPDHRKGEYQALFEKFILDECREWEQEFPRKYLDMIYKIYGLRQISPDTTRTPRFFGKFTRKYIYAPLAHSKGALLEELDRKNPVVYTNGGRRYKFIQFLTEQIGLPALRQHLWQVIGIGSVSNGKDQFKRNFYKAFPEATPIGHQWDMLDPENDA
ncbi:P63C domain-containing protein [Sphingomonas qilianensis]|uniref:P63C domain-containing protein n=1 Tax=Sphingomonas qilianensis TaxID=1736690 RepID=A0ABU9XTZ9_9SPHN